MRGQLSRLALDELRARGRGRLRRASGAFRTPAARGGTMLMCVVVDGKITLSATVPSTGVQAFRAANPGARACPPGRAAVAPPVNVTSLLDGANDGTYAGARRAALLAHKNVDTTAAAISGLARAAVDGRVPAEFAGARIAELVEPPTGAVAALEFQQAQTRVELAAEKADRERGLSDSAKLAAQIAKLNEACLPHVCFMAGSDRQGNPTSINFVTITAEEATKTTGFRRFCTIDDLAKAGNLNESWGSFLVERLQQARAAVGLGPPVGPRVLTVALPGAPPLPAPPPADFSNVIQPGSQYLMILPNGSTAIVPGSLVPEKLAQGWKLA